MKTKLDILEVYMLVEDDYSFDIRVRCDKEFIEAGDMDFNKIKELLQPLKEYIEENV